MAALRASSLEKRLFRIGVAIAACGSLLVWPLFGALKAASFLAGGVLGGVDLLWLRHTVNAIVFRDPKQSKARVLAGFFLRLLLIPFCLYAMIRFLFLDVVAAVAGFASFICSVLIEGILEAFGRSPK